MAFIDLALHLSAAIQWVAHENQNTGLHSVSNQEEEKTCLA